MADSPPDLLRADLFGSIGAPLLEALDAVGIGLIIMEDDGSRYTTVYTNRQNAQLTGHTPEEMIGGDSFGLVAPEELSKLAERRERARRGEPLPRMMETLIVHKDGRRVPIEIGTERVRVEGRDVIIAFNRDLTERVRMHDQLLQADRMATVGLLAAGVAHEINNPLAYISLILDKLVRDLPAVCVAPERLTELVELAAEAQSGAERVGEIIRDLRTFSRSATDPSGLADVPRVLDSSLKIAHNDIRHRARLDIAIDDGLPQVAASEARLGQVFLNLLVNAVQAIPEGEKEKHTIRVEARREGERVRVSIADTGNGIAPEHMPRIFDPFFSTKAPGVGTGLGLSVCKSIIVAMGGDIAVSSTPGMGATFTVMLPLPATASVPRAAAAPSEEAATPPVRGVRILIVDDEVKLAKALARELEQEHRVEVAHGGRQALAQILASDYDLILCDVMMPDLSGLELYDEVRMRRPGVERKMVFMTGGMFTQRARQFLEEVDNPRVDKPFDMSEVREVIRAATSG
jgi:PAS domain S-box-containing protein